jgi:long-subunit fatty acid transport protein
MEKRIIHWFASLLSVSAVCSAEAQTTDELLQLATHEVQSTARYSGMGGAFNALGGDIGVLSTNPAGIGTYRSSEFTLTPSLILNNTVTDFRRESLSADRTRFGVPSLGYIATLVRKDGDASGLVSFSLGIGFNKVANFYKHTKFRGFDSPNSVLDQFRDYAGRNNLNPAYLEKNFNEILPEDWSTAIAFSSQMIGYEDGKYHANGLETGDKVNIDGSYWQSGGTDEYTISFGGNISNKFQFGATIGIQDLLYSSETKYGEQYVEGNKGAYTSSSRTEFTRTTGFGMNLKAGIIYRPVHALRLGFALHTPTLFSMERSYDVSMKSEYWNEETKKNDFKEESSPQDKYEYRLTTPYRVEIGLAYVLGKVGLISIDYELVGNSATHMYDNLDSKDYLSVRNKAIGNKYRASSNVRVGAEINLPYGIMLRGGYNYYQSPYKDSSLDYARHAYSGGIGFRSNSFFFDLAYVLTRSNYYFAPYYVNDYRVIDADNSPDVAREKLNVGRIIATIGFKF